MKLKPWYDVVKPREDLREGKPLDASEFAVHLDKVRLGNAPDDYKLPQRFLDWTYLTEHLTGMAAEVAESAQPMREEARKILAWLAISDEADDLKLDEAQKKQLTEKIQKAKRDLKESIWRG